MRSVLFVDPPAFCTTVEALVAPALRRRPVAVAPPGADRAVVLALSAEARDRLGGMGLGEVVRFHVGEAVGILQEAEGPFDLIFNDIDKQGYPDSLPVMAAKLRPGGTILIDNMLWSGRILDPADRSPATEGVREFTRRIGSDPGWEVTLIPIRDGLILARKV